MPNKLSHFWQELKRRNVVRVITVYAGAAFVIIELINNITEPLRLPEWTPTLVIVLLAIGFPLVIILTWIYDVRPEGGIVKTETAEEAKAEEIPKSSNTWKIASYISFVVIVGLIILNVITRSKGSKGAEILTKSIAVLPFINDSPDDENTYFINGVMEEMLLNLQAIKDFQVPGRTSVEPYRNQSKSIPVIADELNVNYIIEGSGQKYGNTIRLRIQLLEGATGMHMWGESFEQVIQNPEDLFNIQSEIAQSIAAELQALITPKELERIERTPTYNLTAYDFYQRAEHELLIDNLDRAEELFRNALENDPNYADAYIGLAKVFFRRNYWQTIFEENFMDSALILANRALSIDNRLSDAYLIRAVYYWNNDESKRAIDEFERAIEFNPNNGSAYVYGGGLYAESDLVKSLQYYHKALALNRGDQLSIMLDRVGWAYLPAGFTDKSRYYYTEAFKLTKDSMHYFDRLRICEFVDEDFPLAIEYLNKAYAMDSANYDLHGSFGEYYMLNRDYVNSFKHFELWLKEANLTGQNAVYGMHRVGWAYWMNGYEEEGRKFFLKQIDYCNRMLEMGRVIGTAYRNYYDLAASYAFMGQKEMALVNLRLFMKYLTGDKWYAMYFNNDPLFDNIRGEPEFQQIVRDVEAKYQAEHERVRHWLEENGML